MMGPPPLCCVENISDGNYLSWQLHWKPSGTSRLHFYPHQRRELSSTFECHMFSAPSQSHSEQVCGTDLDLAFEDGIYF